MRCVTRLQLGYSSVRPIVLITHPTIIALKNNPMPTCALDGPHCLAHHNSIARCLG